MNLREKSYVKFAGKRIARKLTVGDISRMLMLNINKLNVKYVIKDIETGVIEMTIIELLIRFRSHKCHPSFENCKQTAVEHSVEIFATYLDFT